MQILVHFSRPPIYFYPRFRAFLQDYVCGLKVLYVSLLLQSAPLRFQVTLVSACVSISFVYVYVEVFILLDYAYDLLLNLIEEVCTRYNKSFPQKSLEAWHSGAAIVEL